MEKAKNNIGSDLAPSYPPRRTVVASYWRSKLRRCNSFYRSPSWTAAEAANRRKPPPTRIEGDHRLTRIKDSCTPCRCEPQPLSANLSGAFDSATDSTSTLPFELRLP
ncbi:hypothetical protein PIB30_060256 [Stylosanthes scabra]|uniref:Uncharacterized protein n=1 Tax=Stylosanthes scabra TaxID=79078 RepID=A0ABU6QKU2_9FABA|nr:hypothetical protein [Stylosanthes scabra]